MAQTNFDPTNKINISGPLTPTTTDTPVDIRTRIKVLADITEIPLAYKGMIVYCEADDKYYRVKTLKSKFIGTREVPDYFPDQYEEYKTSDVVDIDNYKTAGAILPLNSVYVYRGRPTHAISGYNDKVSQNHEFIAICYAHDSESSTAQSIVVYLMDDHGNYVFDSSFDTDEAETEMQKFIASSMGASLASEEYAGLMSADDKKKLREAHEGLTAAASNAEAAAQSASDAAQSALAAQDSVEGALSAAQSAAGSLATIQQQIENMTTPEGEIIPENVVANVANNKTQIDTLGQKIGGSEEKELQYSLDGNYIISNVNIGDTIAFEEYRYRQKGIIEVSSLATGGKVTINNLRPANANDIVLAVTNGNGKVLLLERGVDTKVFKTVDFQLPQGAAYVYFLYYSNTNLPEPKYTNTSGLTERVDELEVQLDDVKNDERKNAEDITALTNSVDEIKNITVSYDFDNEGYVRNYGSLNKGSNGYHYTNPIKLQEGDKLNVKARGSKGNVAIIAYCNEDLSSITPIEDYVANGNLQNLEFIPQSDCYVVISRDDNYESSILVTLKKTANQFIIEELDKTKERVDKLEHGTRLRVNVGVGYDYPTLRSAIEFIESQEPNDYSIYIYKDIDILQEYTEAELSTPMNPKYSWLGIYIPERTRLVGIKNPTIKLDWNGTADNNRSLLNVYGDFSAENITFEGCNIRYLIHQDCGDKNNKNSEYLYCKFVTKKHTMTGHTGNSIGMGIGDNSNVLFKNCSFFNGNNTLKGHIHFGGHLDATLSPCSVTADRCTFIGGLAVCGFGGSNSNQDIINYVNLIDCSFDSPIMIGGDSTLPTSTKYRGSKMNSLRVIKNPSLSASAAIELYKYCEVNTEMFVNNGEEDIPEGGICVEADGGVRLIQSTDKPTQFRGFALQNIPKGDYGILQTSGNVPSSIVGIKIITGNHVYLKEGSLSTSSSSDALELGYVKYAQFLQLK